MEIKTKSRGGGWRHHLGGDVGADCRKASFPSCHHRHHQCHALHDDNSDHGSESGHRPFKKSAFGGEKQLLVESLSNSPQSGENANLVSYA